MSLAEHLSKIREAGTDPQAVALVTLEILLEGRKPELRRAVECAAIPHWFDERIFTALLDPDLQPASAEWFKAVVALSAVEPFPARSGYNVHEATRLALRKRLATQHPDRFAELSRRAVTAFDGAAAAFRIERVFDRLIEASDDAVRELRGLEYDLRANPEDALSLARMLSEYAAGSELESVRPRVVAPAAGDPAAGVPRAARSPVVCRRGARVFRGGRFRTR